MPCTKRISSNIVSDCSTVTVGGVELVAYICNRLDLNPVYDSQNKAKVTGFTITAGKVMYKFTGTAKNLKVSHTATIDETIGKTYKHKMTFPVFDFSSTNVLMVDNMDDLVIFVEYKQKNTTGDGIFVGYGLASGLWCEKDDRDSSVSNASRMVEFGTRDQEGEPVSQYNLIKTDYATTKALLEASLTNV